MGSTESRARRWVPYAELWPHPRRPEPIASGRLGRGRGNGFHGIEGEAMSSVCGTVASSSLGRNRSPRVGWAEGEAIGSVARRARQWVPCAELWPHPRWAGTDRLGSAGPGARRWVPCAELWPHPDRAGTDRLGSVGLRARQWVPRNRGRGNGLRIRDCGLILPGVEPIASGRAGRRCDDGAVSATAPPDAAVDPWRDVVGQEGAVRRLAASVAGPVHAYLLVGPPGSGKQALARAFAAALLSVGAEDDARASVTYAWRSRASTPTCVSSNPRATRSARATPSGWCGTPRWRRSRAPAR